MAQGTYEYKRYMRDGSVKTITALVRQKKKPKESKKNGITTGKTGMGDG